MSIPKQLLALMVAASVANPLCCCAGKTNPEAADIAGEHESIPSCCANKAAEQSENQPESPPDAPACPCKKGKNAITESSHLKVDEFSGPELAVPSPGSEPIMASARPGAGHVTAIASLPPPRSARLLYCRYLL